MSPALCASLRAQRDRRLLSPGCFEQEPDAALALIDPVFEEACGSDVAGIIADGMGGEHAQDQSFFVFAQFTQHVGRINIVGVIVRDALQTGDVADERMVVPPILRTRSAISSVMAKIWSPWSSSRR